MLGSSILNRRRGSAPLPRAVYPLRMGETVAPRLTEETAQAISPYRRGQRLITRTIGMLPLELERNGVKVDQVPPLLERPVPWMARQAAVETMVASLIDYGNYFALLAQFGPTGLAQGLVPVHPRQVAVALDDQGMLYRIGQTIYRSSDVMHIRAGGPVDSLLGQGVLQTSATTLETSASVSGASRYFYADGIYPAGILEVEDPDLPEDEADLLRQRWVSKVRRGEPAVLPAGIKWQAVVSPNAEQAQLAQANGMSRQGVADLLDLDGDWLGVPNSSMTYANIVDRVDNLIRLTCQPWMTAIEEAFTELTTRPTRVRFATSALLRGQQSQRYADYATGLGAGFLTNDEVRAEEGRPPLPADDATAAEADTARAVAEVLQKLYLATPGKVVVTTQEARELARQAGAAALATTVPDELAAPPPTPPAPGPSMADDVEEGSTR